MDEKTIKSTKKYECFFMTLYEDDVVLDTGKKTKRMYITHDGAAAVLPITKDGKITLVKQYRYPVREIMLEIPAGKKDNITESGLECIERELLEETGYESKDITKLYDIHTCVGYSNELIELFIAKDCIKTSELNTDEDEDIELVLIDPSEVETLLSSGKITDGKTLIALQQYLLKHIIK